VNQDIETAAMYGLKAAAFAHESYHKIGAQPVLESDRIDDLTEAHVRFAILLLSFNP
jgi:hypothetical protein